MRTRRRSGGGGSGWGGVGGSGGEAPRAGGRGRARGGRSGDGRGRLMATSEANDPLVDDPLNSLVGRGGLIMIPPDRRSGLRGCPPAGRYVPGRGGSWPLMLAR